MKNKSFFRSLLNALRGIACVFVFEKNFRIHTVIAIVAISLAFYFDLDALEWGILLVFMGLVLVSEIINSCLERFLDATLGFRNDRTKEIKDMAAGAVLVASLLAAVVGVLIFLPKL